jgi:predicted RNA-binding protein
MLLEARDGTEARELLRSSQVRKWHKYIQDQAMSAPTEALLFVPCAKAKPYLPPTKSFFYNWLWRYLDKQNLRKRVFICTVSEPFALFPETDYQRMPDYELSPLVLKSDPHLLEDYSNILAKPIAGFLERNHDKHGRILAYVRPDSTHALFLMKAMRLVRKPVVRFAVTTDDLKRIRRSHRRMWHLNWMIYLESRLTRALS